ncbi:MAG: Maf family protein [Planctomycetaceae bacterium]|jgi:septum formation protein|nr:Maf family protein [Planctomycetaceae bacterium]
MNIICNNNYIYAGHIYLASQSPRRRELLTAMGLSFEVLPPDDGVEDARKLNEQPCQYVCRQAIQKACNVAEKIEFGCVIACDTVVCCGGELLGKPSDKNDARHMLKCLRGKKHQVISGLCVLTKKIYQPKQSFQTSIKFHQDKYVETNFTMDKSAQITEDSNTNSLKVIAEQTELVMQKITDQEIESYLDNNVWKDKAGAFGYQDNNSWIKIINGSESNVVGLPIERLRELLEQNNM